MPEGQKKLIPRPGVNTQASQTLGEGGWYASNLIRWRDGYLEKVAGWLRLFSSACAGVVRGMHAWASITGDPYLLIGSTTALQLWDGTTLHTVRAPTVVELVIPGDFTGVGGTSTVQVVYTAHGLSTGDIIAFPMAVSLQNSVSGVPLFPGTAFTVTVIDANTYTFDSGTVSATNITAGNLAAYNTLVTSTTVTVNFRGHGLTSGDNWSVYETTIIGSTVIAIGTYTVTVLSANSFTIELPLPAPDSGGSREGNNTSTPVQLTSATFPSTVNWFIDNFGENAVFCYENGPLSQWVPPPTAGANVATLISTGPAYNGGILAAMPQAQIVSWRAESSGVQDPLLIRFSDVGSTSVWTASSTNQAGSYHLSRGSRIVGGVQGPSSTFIWTDLDLWSMQYTGPPFVYSFNIIGVGCGLIAPRAACVLNGTTYWMSGQNFYKFDGSGLVAIECPVWDVVFRNLSSSTTVQNKIVAGANSPAQEVWFFYPSANSTEIDSYVKMNVQNGLWDYGSLVRTAWIDENVFGTPLGADADFHVQQHEKGYDNDTAAMDGAYAETAYMDLSDGSDMIFIDQYIPDFKWFGSNGWVEVTLYAKNYPGENPRKFGPFNVTRETRFIIVRQRARQIAIRFTWGTYAGFAARLGAPRFRTSSSGRRP